MFFFFSSRRRHTRFDCDWSSDVCSSDLRVVARQIDDGILRRVEHFRELGDPPLPGQAAPEIISPQEAPLEQILAETSRFLLVEVGRAHLGHHDEGAAEQHIVGEANQQRVGLAVGHADVGACQLAEADREIDVGARVIDAPVAAVAAEVAAKPDAAEVERAVEVLVGGELSRAEVAEAPEAALPELRFHADRQRQGYHPGQEQNYGPPPSHEVSLPSKWKSGKVEKWKKGKNV